MNCLSKSLAAGVLALAVPARAGDLVVEVGGVRSDEGRVMLALHTEQEGVEFPDEAGAVTGAWTEARTGTWRLVFRDVPDGRYAVTVIHDENGNGELETNLLGVPVEGYGFSNDAEGFMGPPTFADASVEVGDEDGHALVNLRY